MANRILVIDDEQDMQSLINQRFRKQIKENIFSFEYAFNGIEALEKLKTLEDIYLIVTDINMPGMDGITLLNKIKEINRPIMSLVVSAYGDMKNIRSAMNAGAFDFLTKPFDFVDFETTLDKTLANIRFVLQSIENTKQLENERIEKIKAQEEALKQAEEKALLISEQNRMLEIKVDERTLELREKNNLITKEKERSDALLLNILPYKTAQELKDTGKSEASLYNDVSVMFTDFQDFSIISEQLTPTELVSEIDLCFQAFDNIVGKYEIEKIKTIGDSYMAACGLPIENKMHAIAMVNAAIEIQEFIQQRKQSFANQPNKKSFDIRIGIHSGPVVAGIVGLKKFAYDIWGDTVNTASRMESSGAAGKINVSGHTYELIKDYFKCEYRGKISAKNKGEIDMYFVEKK